MAYNPGVSDISGQIRAQGMTRGINSLLEGFNAGIKTYEQNKQIADTSIADFGAAVANSESLKALLADEEQRATLPSDVVKAYLKLNKEGSLGAREASLLGGFARSYIKTEEDKQQRAFRTAQMEQMKQQSTIAQQASSIAQAENARQQAAAARTQEQFNRNAATVENMRRTMDTAGTLNAAVVRQLPDAPPAGPASLGGYKDVLRPAPLPAPITAPVTSGNPFTLPVPPPSIDVPNSPLRSGTATPTPNVNVLENKMGNVPVASNMGGAGVLTTQAADRIKRRAEALEGTSLGQMIAQGINLTDEQMVNLTGRDLVATAAANKATAAAENQRVKNELQGVLLEIRAAKLGSDPSPIVASMRRAYDEGWITRDEQIKYIKDFFVKAGTPPESQAAAFERMLNERVERDAAEKSKTGAASTQTPAAAARGAAVTPKASTNPGLPPAPKGSVYMMDTNGNVGLVLDKNVKKAMDMGGTVL